jgi:hypothetical protein
MGFCVWVSWQDGRKKPSLWSKSMTLKMKSLSQALFTYRERREHRVFDALLQMIPGLEQRLIESSDDEDVLRIAELVSISHFVYGASYLLVRKIQKGVSGARADDTKSLKGAILDWIVPRGESLYPSLSRNVKMDRGFHHERTGSLLCPAGMDWSNPESVLPLSV